MKISNNQMYFIQSNDVSFSRFHHLPESSIGFGLSVHLQSAVENGVQGRRYQLSMKHGQMCPFWELSPSFSACCSANSIAILALLRMGVGRERVGKEQSSIVCPSQHLPSQLFAVKTNIITSSLTLQWLQQPQFLPPQMAFYELLTYAFLLSRILEKSCFKIF